ncbi:hypothetical protein B0T14DRAFT_2897 [Immersiella caudata]|uniref:Uncharacterized protein n=1 Tax=Immersiella caudata TaxID=314043 RepID=A0AA39XDK1_9PEZI|nr:hypothetical protein B0T14DRAFT_2897 [Immersiella caudata]
MPSFPQRVLGIPIFKVKRYSVALHLAASYPPPFIKRIVPFPISPFHCAISHTPHAMKWTALTLLSLLDIALAGRWKVVGRPESLRHYNGNGQVTTAVKQAISLAGTALEVLNTELENPHVQIFVRYILGDDANQLRFAKDYFAKVMTYEREESTLPVEALNSDQDALIFIDNSNHEERADGRLWLKAQNLPHLPDNAEMARDCFRLRIDDRDDGGRLIQGLTNRPNAYTPEYYLARAAWMRRQEEAERNGVENNEDPPDSTGQYTAQTNKPNCIDIATWFLDEVVDEGPEGKSFVQFNPQLYVELTNPNFLNDLKGDQGEYKQIDGLAGHLSLPAMILHEVSSNQPDLKAHKENK